MTKQHEDDIDFIRIQEKNLEALTQGIENFEFSNELEDEKISDENMDNLCEEHGEVTDVLAQAEEEALQIEEVQENILQTEESILIEDIDIALEEENNEEIEETIQLNARIESKELDVEKELANIAEVEVLEPILEEESKDIQLEDILTNPVLNNQHSSVFRKGISFIQFVCKYIITASFIFVILMMFSNYSAYITIAKSYLNPDQIEQSEKEMHKSIEVSQIEIAKKEKKKKPASTSTGSTQKTEKKVEDSYNAKDLRHIVGDIRNEDIQLDIEVIPFVNRVVIPKIGKNIPLVDIAQGQVEGLDELNDIFMQELEGGVVRYPGSAKPGEFGNSFIFGHSSNFPWMPGDYNDVFVLLDKVEIGDEVVSYYEGKKYTYKIHEKKVISPNDVGVLKRDTGKKEMTLMTCWPIGTTYNRLLIIGELVNE